MYRYIYICGVYCIRKPNVRICVTCVPTSIATLFSTSRAWIISNTSIQHTSMNIYIFI